MICDGDEQGASNRWRSLRLAIEKDRESKAKRKGGAKAKGVAAGRLHTIVLDLSRPAELSAAVEAFDPQVLITDCPPRFKDFGREQAAFVAGCDLIVIPLLLDGDNLAATITTLKLLKDNEVLKKGWGNCLLLPIRHVGKSNFAEQILDAINATGAEYGIPVAAPVVNGGAKRGEAKETGRTYGEAGATLLAYSYDTLAFSIIQQFNLRRRA